MRPAKLTTFNELAAACQYLPPDVGYNLVRDHEEVLYREMRKLPIFRARTPKRFYLVRYREVIWDGQAVYLGYALTNDQLRKERGQKYFWGCGVRMENTITSVAHFRGFRVESDGGRRDYAGRVDINLLNTMPRYLRDLTHDYWKPTKDRLLGRGVSELRSRHHPSYHDPRKDGWGVPS